MKLVNLTTTTKYEICQGLKQVYSKVYRVFDSWILKEFEVIEM